MKKIGYILIGVLIGGVLLNGNAIQAAVETVAAQRSTMLFFLNGSPVEAEAYVINGNNYLKLRDIAALVDFGVSYSEASRAVMIDTMVGYTPESQTQAQSTQRKETAQQQETTPTAPPSYHQQANAAVFDDVYTEVAYDALRQCMAEGRSAAVDMSTATREAMNRVTGALGSYPAFDIEPLGNGTVYFQSKHPIAYEESGKIARSFVSGLAGKSEKEKLYAMACYVCERLDYDAESTTTPRTLFASNTVSRGNCVSFSRNFQYLCDVAGIPCVLVHSDIHQWAEVYTDGRWYNVDLTSFDHHYTEGDWGLLGVEADLQGVIYAQSEPQLTTFLKELYIPGSTK